MAPTGPAHIYYSHRARLFFLHSWFIIIPGYFARRYESQFRFAAITYIHRARVTRCQLKSPNEHLQSIYTSIVGQNVSFESCALKPIGPICISKWAGTVIQCPHRSCLHLAESGQNKIDVTPHDWPLKCIFALSPDWNWVREKWRNRV